MLRPFREPAPPCWRSAQNLSPSNSRKRRGQTDYVSSNWTSPTASKYPRRRSDPCLGPGDRPLPIGSELTHPVVQILAGLRFGRYPGLCPYIVRVSRRCITRGQNSFPIGVHSPWHDSRRHDPHACTFSEGLNPPRIEHSEVPSLWGSTHGGVNRRRRRVGQVCERMKSLRREFPTIM